MTLRGVPCCCRPVYSKLVFIDILAVVSMSNILMNRMRSRIVRFLIRNGPATSADMASALQASSPTIRRHLALMRGAGLVERADQRFSVRVELVREQATEAASTFGLTVMPNKPQISMNEGKLAKPFPQERNYERIE